MTRAERAEQVAALRAEGLNGVQIANRLGIGRSYAYELLNDPEGRKVRTRKESYRGQCIDCGAPTDGSNGPNGVRPRCYRCATRLANAARKLWVRERLIGLIQEWADIYGEPPAVWDWNPWGVRHECGDERRARRFESAEGYWPSTTTVIDEFGSWNAALRTAGFEPRAPHGGDGNQWRRRNARRKVKVAA